VSFETCGSWLQAIVCVTLCAGCTTAKPLPSRPIRVAVGPIVMEAPVSSSTKIHSFDEEPSPEREPLVRAELIAEVEERSQRQLTEELVGHEAGVDVIITGRILVYGTVPAKYWLSTYAVSETGQLIAVGC
jgi:hypothetical protein